MVDAVFWFSDVAFATGMLMALNADKTKNGIIGVHKFIVKEGFYKKQNIPQHQLKAIKDKAAKRAYALISTLLLFAAGFTAVTDLIGTPRGILFNLMYIFWSLLTVYVSAHDILLDDDKSEWKPHVKARHVLFPINLEGMKVYQTPVSKLQVDALKNENKNKLAIEVPKFAASAVAALLGYAVLPSAAFFLATPAFLYAHNQMNKILNGLIEIFSLNNAENRFNSLFGDIENIIRSGESHDEFGKQYHYFTFFFKPLEKLCKRHFFIRVRSQYKASVAEAKAAYYLGRGALVVTLLFTLNLLNKNNFAYEGQLPEVVRHFSSVFPYMLYYGFHAACAYANQKLDDSLRINFKQLFMKFDEMGAVGEALKNYSKLSRDCKYALWKGALVMVPETILAGYCFYKPILDSFIA